MKNKYTSSIVYKYGDTENVLTDLKDLKEIISRQGTSLLLDAIAEHVGLSVNNFNLSRLECEKLKDSLVNELSEALNERT